MGALTESEIFSCMAENFRLGAEACEQLARSPRKGDAYNRLTDCLELIEGCCRQASAWRQDTRWLDIGMWMGRARQLSGDWLRGVKVGPGPRRRIPAGQLHPMFMFLAGKMRESYAKAIAVRDQATGAGGMILPTPVKAPAKDVHHHTVRLPAGMIKTASGLILPSGLAAQ